VVGVDDAHLLDDLSAVLVQRLAVSGVATVVLTVRAGEPVPEAVSRLWRDEQVRRVEIQPLTRAATEDLLRVVLGGPIDSGSTSRLWSLTRGNALFLRHLVDGELESGRLCLVDGLWCWQSAPMRLPRCSRRSWVTSWGASATTYAMSSTCWLWASRSPPPYSGT
jgi:hypothetical protein